MTEHEALVVPASWRQRARDVFVRTLAQDTSAIQDLLAWHPSNPVGLADERAAEAGRLPITPRMVERLQHVTTTAGRSQAEVEAWLLQLRGWPSVHAITRADYWVVCAAVEGPGNLPQTLPEAASPPVFPHHHDITVGTWAVSSQALIRDAGPELVAEASAWTERWRVGSAVWLHTWAVFALLRCDVARQCADASCSYDCRRVQRGTLQDALAMVLAPSTMRRLEMGDGSKVSLTAELRPAGGHPTAMAGQAGLMYSGLDSINCPVPGPEPLLETRSEFLARAAEAWEDAASELRRRGTVLVEPRKLERHCHWLVRYQVCRHTVAEILADDVDVDPSAVRKAIRATARLLDLPLRDGQ